MYIVYGLNCRKTKFLLFCCSIAWRDSILRSILLNRNAILCLFAFRTQFRCVCIRVVFRLASFSHCFLLLFALAVEWPLVDFHFGHWINVANRNVKSLLFCHFTQSECERELISAGDFRSQMAMLFARSYFPLNCFCNFIWKSTKTVDGVVPNVSLGVLVPLSLSSAESNYIELTIMSWIEFASVKWKQNKCSRIHWCMRTAHTTYTNRLCLKWMGLISDHCWWMSVESDNLNQRSVIYHN